MPQQTTPARVMLTFASALVARDFCLARELLTPELADAWPAEALRRELDSMVDYGQGPPDEAMTPVADVTLPGVSETDSGWAYVSITGPGFVEGVHGIVTKRGFIRTLEWGRPWAANEAESQDNVTARQTPPDCGTPDPMRMMSPLMVATWRRKLAAFR